MEPIISLGTLSFKNKGEDFDNNPGIRLWKSKDLKNWEDLGLVWKPDGRNHKFTWVIRTVGTMDRLDSPRHNAAITAPEIHYLKGTFWLALSHNGYGTGLLKSTSGKPEGPPPGCARRRSTSTSALTPRTAERCGRVCRTTMGHWEDALIHGAQETGNWVTLVERNMRFSLVGRTDSKNGKEFARHEELARTTGMEVFFARPDHSWERGTNENTNGLIRRLHPKKSSFAGIGKAELNRIDTYLNDRLRKSAFLPLPLEERGGSKTLPPWGTAELRSETPIMLAFGPLIGPSSPHTNSNTMEERE